MPTNSIMLLFVFYKNKSNIFFQCRHHMMILLSKINMLGSKQQLVGTISFLLLMIRFASVIDIVEGMNVIRSLADLILISSSSIEKYDMINEIDIEGMQNLKDLIIDDVKRKENSNEQNDNTINESIRNDDSDSKIPPEKIKKDPNIDTIRPKLDTKTEELGCLDQLPLDVLELGREEMSRRKLIICGISRDNAINLPPVMEYIERTGQLFSNYRVIIFENDSIDGTKDILNDWENTNDKVTIITHDYNNKKRPAISFLAEARNYYLYEILNNTDTYQDYDMMMVVDMDMVFGWDMRGIYHSFSQVNDWDLMCSNGVNNHLGRMHDYFAFEIVAHSQDDYSFQFDEPCGGGSGGKWTDGYSWYFPSDAPLVPVTSCFGGTAFYRLSTIEGCYYDSLAGECEHVPFHQCMSSKHQGRLYMNPAQMLRYLNYDLK